MDLKVSWSPEAIEDIESIAEYIARDSLIYAQSTVSKILDFTRSVVQFPKIGRIVPEMNDKKIRERLIHNYRIIYKLEDHRILIVAVIHGKQLFDFISERMS